MTKVFISQPMADKTEQEILEERASVFQLAKESFPDAELIDSYLDDYEPSTGNVGLKYLAKSLELLARPALVITRRGSLAALPSFLV